MTNIDRASLRVSGVSLPVPAEAVAVSSRRWIIICVFAALSSINYLDRQLLAATAPDIKMAFGLSNSQYGLLISAFSFAYMLCAPAAGVLVDRFNLRTTATVSVAAWCLITMLTGSLTFGFATLVTLRFFLGAAEASGVPSSSKASATYLSSREQAFGNSIHSVGMTLGAVAAPIIAGVVSPVYGWRSVFLIAGFCTLGWIPLWLWISREVPTPATLQKTKKRVPVRSIMGDRRLWAVVIASSLVIATQSLWANWTTVFLVQEYRMTQAAANAYFAWIPPVFASLGGIVGGIFAMKYIRLDDLLRSRLRICYLGAPLLCGTALVPLMPSAVWVVVAICISFFACTMVLINMHVIPIDLFGAEHAGFTSSCLVASFALAQMVISPAIGFFVDHFSFRIVCVLISMLSLLGILVLAGSTKPPATEPRA